MSEGNRNLSGSQFSSPFGGPQAPEEMSGYVGGGSFSSSGEGGHGPVVGMVPVSALMAFREHSGNQHSESGQVVSGIAGELASGQALRNPLVLEWNHRKGLMSLGEGNHRLAAAARAGLTHVPVRVVRAGYMDRGIPVVGGPPADRHGYVPGDIHPHWFPALRPS